MPKIGIIRCEKNQERCPLTGCINSLNNCAQGFSIYEAAELMGVFACKCPGDNVENLGKVLKSKGAEAIHFCTCTFARKEEDGWVMGNGFCDYVDELLKKVSTETALPCVKGSAHLPPGYKPEVFG